MAQPLKSAAAQKLTVLGSWGQFGGTGGSPRVFYLQTVLCPGNAGTPECELSELVVPVREVFEMEKLTFDQLLQRDLDDHRVASDLIPYLIDRPNIPKFFPPILAVVVPFEKNAVGINYGERKETEQPLAEGWVNSVMQFSGLFDFVRPYETEAKQHSRGSAELRLNRQSVRLMVVDGQHRAMALLAIQRNLLNGWEKTRGESFKHFYSDIDLTSIPTAQLNQIELPVCVCFFPDVTEGSQGLDLQQICRKIFLDVNREARAPSESRNILMDDYNLRAVFTRAVFAKAKEGQGIAAGLKLRHVEYDNPRDVQQVEKGIALSNVRTIENAISWLLVRPDGYYNDVTTAPAKGKFKVNNARLQRVLHLSDHLSDDDLTRWQLGSIADIKVDNFPFAAREKLSRLFQDSWGAVVVQFLSTYYPFQKHILAVDEVYKTSEDAGAEFRLARQGLFEGQGLYHTLKVSAEKRAEQRTKQPDLVKSAAEKAWGQVEKWLEDVYKVRATKMMGKTSETATDVAQVNRSMDTLRTQAFQVGALMAIAYLAEQIKADDLTAQSREWIDAASATWQSNVGRQLKLFDRTKGQGLASIYPGTLQPADWPFFRYCFFEEILAGLDATKSVSVRAIVQTAVDKGRVYLLERLKRDLATRAKKEGKKATPSGIQKEALGVLRRALKTSLAVTQEELDESLVRGTAGVGVIAPADIALEDEQAAPEDNEMNDVDM